jgi:hypothetical protein
VAIRSQAPSANVGPEQTRFPFIALHIESVAVSNPRQPAPKRAASTLEAKPSVQTAAAAMDEVADMADDADDLD